MSNDVSIEELRRLEGLRLACDQAVAAGAIYSADDIIAIATKFANFLTGQPETTATHSPR